MAQGNTLRCWFILLLTFSMQNKVLKYDISTSVHCPLCDNDIQVGTAGPQGLDQHQGKKKFLATITKKKEEEQNGKKPHPVLIPSEERQGKAICFLEISFFGLIYPLWEGRGEGVLPNAIKKFADPVQFLTSWDHLAKMLVRYHAFLDHGPSGAVNVLWILLMVFSHSRITVYNMIQFNE